MKYFWLINAILLFALSVPLVMGYRILPIEGTPYWLFGIFFVINCIHIVLSLRVQADEKKSIGSTYQVVLSIVILAISLGGVTGTSVVDRHNTAPVWGVHDIILQQEAAIRYLVKGKNPYKETYFGTPVESFHYDELGMPAVNPALYHFVMPPWYVLSALPVYGVANKLFGYFDGRMALVLIEMVALYCIYKLFSEKSLGMTAATLLALSPASVNYFIEGRSDAAALGWLLGAILLLKYKRYTLSAIVFGLAVMTKQTIWFAVPLYGVLVWKEYGKSIGNTLKTLTISAVTCFILVLPFLWWDPHAFLDSVVFYLSGNVSTGYPISGYGLGMVLYSLGLIKDIHAYYPFAVWQLLLGGGVLIISIGSLAKKTSISMFWILYAVVLLTVWYTSRYFNNSHIAFISSLFIIGGLLHIDEVHKSNAKKK